MNSPRDLTAQSVEPNMLSTRTAQSVEPNLLSVYSARDLTTMSQLKARSPGVLTAQPLEPNLLSTRTARSSSSGSSLHEDAESTDVHTCLEVEEVPETGMNTPRSCATSTDSTGSVLIRSSQDAEIPSEISRSSQDMLAESIGNTSRQEIQLVQQVDSECMLRDLRNQSFSRETLCSFLIGTPVNAKEIRAHLDSLDNAIVTPQIINDKVYFLTHTEADTRSAVKKASDPNLNESHSSGSTVPRGVDLHKVKFTFAQLVKLLGQSTCQRLEQEFVKENQLSDAESSQLDTSRESISLDTNRTNQSAESTVRSSSGSSLHEDTESTDGTSSLESEEFSESEADSVTSFSSTYSTSTSSSHDNVIEPFDWCRLPVEMKCECMKYMCFETRMKLRATARLEKQLVESRKMAVKNVNVFDLFDDATRLSVNTNNFREISEELSGSFHGSVAKVISLIVSLIKYSKIKVFQLWGARRAKQRFTNDSIAFFERITAGGNFKFPILGIYGFNDQNFQSFFEFIPSGTDVIDFCHPPERGFKRVFRDPDTLPVLLGASTLQFEGREAVPLMNTVVEAWLRNDQVVGKKIVFWLGAFEDGIEVPERFNLRNKDPIFTDFKNKWLDRIVEEKKDMIRIAMDDPSKHILLRIVREEDDVEETMVVIVVWETIPADLKEEEFSKKSGRKII